MSELLRLESASAGYGQAIVLSNMNLSLGEGEALAILGRNGMGKTTLLNTIMGATRLRGGRIWWRERDVTGMASHRRAALGIGWVPQERDIFQSLTVEENLTAVARRGEWDPQRVFKLFPRLAERRKVYGDCLSGGEQQMLAIGRALVLNPSLLLLDEPLEGLAPIIVHEILSKIREMIRTSGLAIMLVEQKAREVLAFTKSAVILEKGRVVYSGASSELHADLHKLDRWLSATGSGEAL